MTDTRCPRPTELSAYALGTLDESLADQLADHVGSCAACEQTLHNLDGTVDVVLSQLRQPAVASPFAGDATYQQRLAAVEALSSEPSHARSQPEVIANHAVDVFPQLRDYQIIAKLGQGGMGAVYKALHTRLDKIVAIKVLSASLWSNPGAIARFSREMKAIGRLEHPNVIRAHDAGEFEGQHFLVMEFVDGVDLSDLTRSQGKLPIPEACELIRQAALGLEYAHQKGLVHRDIKPSNLMLSTEGQVKILDLGLALLNQADVPQRELTSTGQIMGTIDYMAPEQGGDTHHVDIRADIYSLGATLYKLLTGEAPFANPAHTTMMQKLTALATQQPVPLRDRRPEVPAALAEIVDRMLARLPDHRYVTPSAVAQALQPFCTGADLNRLNPIALITSFAAGHRQQAVADSPTLLTATATTESYVAEALATSGTTSPGGVAQRPPARYWLTWGAAVAVLLAGFILYWKTPQGATVRVEISDPQTQARFDGEGLLVTSSEKDQSPIQVKLGTTAAKEGARELAGVQHTLLIKRGDVEFKTQQFELKRSGQTLVKVEIVKDLIAVTSDDRLVGLGPLTRPAVTAAKAPVRSFESPEFLKWADEVGKLPVTEQGAAVVKKLKELNPNFDGEAQHKIHGEHLTEFDFHADHVTDISPLRALPHLTHVASICSPGVRGKLADLLPLAGLKLDYFNCCDTSVADLSPLRGAPLTQVLCGNTPVSSLEPLRGMRLKLLWCYRTQISDLAPLQGMPLRNLSIHNNPALKDLSPLRGTGIETLAVSSTSVSDLSPLQGEPLVWLECSHTRISDLSPLKGKPLKYLACQGTEVTDFFLLRGMPLENIDAPVNSVRDAELLRSISTLRTINGKPIDEFWKEAGNN